MDFQVIKGGKSKTKFQQDKKREREIAAQEGDSEYWFCICFHTHEDLVDFKMLTGIEGKYISGIDLRERTAFAQPPMAQRSFAKARTYDAGKDFLADVEWTGDFAIDCHTELMMLKERMNPPKKTWKASYDEVTESPYWICAFFKDRNDKNFFLAAHNLMKLGDKYIDGSFWLEKLRTQSYMD